MATLQMIILGYGNRDTIYGYGGSDYIDGGSGDDHLAGNSNLDDNTSDTLLGQDGDDIIWGGYGDYISGGSGIDSLGLQLYNMSTAVEIDFTYLWAGYSYSLGTTQIQGMEKLNSATGTYYDDILVTGTPYGQFATITGQLGSDLIIGGAGQDFLYAMPPFTRLAGATTTERISTTTNSTGWTAMMSCTEAWETI